MEENINDIVIMASEPIPDMSPAEVRNCFVGKQTEKDLADAFAMSSNKFFWVEDNIYDYEEGSEEYVAACAITDEWCALMDEYEEKIFAILRSEGIAIPQTGRIHVLKPFMKRNGYVDGNGWWVKAEK